MRGSYKFTFCLFHIFFRDDNRYNLNALALFQHLPSYLLRRFLSYFNCDSVKKLKDFKVKHDKCTQCMIGSDDGSQCKREVAAVIDCRLTKNKNVCKKLQKYKQYKYRHKEVLYVCEHHFNAIVNDFKAKYGSKAIAFIGFVSSASYYFTSAVTSIFKIDVKNISSVFDAYKQVQLNYEGLNVDNLLSLYWNLQMVSYSLGSVKSIFVNDYGGELLDEFDEFDEKEDKFDEKEDEFDEKEDKSNDNHDITEHCKIK